MFSNQGSFEEVPDEEAKKKVEISGKTRPTWFLGSEDHSVQVSHFFHLYVFLGGFVFCYNLCVKG